MVFSRNGRLKGQTPAPDARTARRRHGVKGEIWLRGPNIMKGSWQLAPYKKVRAVEFIDQIPKSPTGKILRRVLKDRVRAGVH